MELAEVVQDAEETVVDATEVQEVPEQQEQSAAAEGATTAQAAEDDGEIVVSIAGESPPQEEEDQPNDTAWLKDLRKQNREKTRKLRELEAEVQRLKGSKGEPEAVVVGAKPTLEGCDYDADAFAEKLEQWHERKRQADAQAAEKQKAEHQAQQAWQAKLSDYEKAKAALKVPDYAEAEEAVREVCSETQQGVIVHGLDARTSALMVYALGKNPARLQKLAGIKDPVQFAIAVGELKKDLQVKPRREAPAPERVVRAAGALPAVGAAQVEKLRAEAQKTGDFTAYLEAKRKLKG